ARRRRRGQPGGGRRRAGGRGGPARQLYAGKPYAAGHHGGGRPHRIAGQLQLHAHGAAAAARGRR
ncbi:unnamed protein product, partial [Prorocentrum cordatum]